MKKLITILLFFATVSAHAQTQYNLYMDSVGQQHISLTRTPQVALTGRYSDLVSKPTIYTFSGSSGQYTKGDGTYGTLPAGYTFTGSSSQYTTGTGTYVTFPTNVSSFTNDAGYQTATSVSNLLNKSANYTILSTDFVSGKPPILHIWVDCTSGALTATLPTASSFTGYVVVVGKTDNSGNLLTVSGCSYDNKMSVQNSVKEFYSNGTSWVQN